MTDAERQLMVLKCGKILQDVLVEIRALSWEEGHTKRINDLADLTHNLPMFLVGLDDFVMGYIRNGLLDYARAYCPDVKPELHRFVQLFDMDEVTFRELHCRRLREWPEAATAPAA